MKHRKLRIAWSVAWGIACVLLIALWVRSYQSAITYEMGNNTLCVSSKGVALVQKSENINLVPGAFGEHGSLINPANSWNGFYVSWNSWTDCCIQAPYWFIALSISVIAASSWLPLKQFGLRTLLIATTLVAVVLGLIVWAAK